MLKNHSVHIIATYALLILAAPLISTSIASAQAVNCPAGFTCTPVNSSNTSNTYNNGYYYSGGYTGTTQVAPSAATTQVVPTTASQTSGSGGSPCYFFGTNLSLGSRGEDVVVLQDFLLYRGYNIPNVANGWVSKGYFGYQTATALRQYQAANGVNEDGYFGPITREKVNTICGYTQNRPVTYDGNVANVSLIVTAVGTPTFPSKYSSRHHQQFHASIYGYLSGQFDGNRRQYFNRFARLEFTGVSITVVRCL